MELHVLALISYVSLGKAQQELLCSRGENLLMGECPDC